MGSSQSKSRRRSDDNRNNKYDRHRNTLTKRSSGAQRLREDADRLRRTHGNSPDYQREVRPQAAYNIGEPDPVVRQHTTDNLHKQTRNNPRSRTARPPTEGQPRRRGRAEKINVISAGPMVTDKRTSDQIARTFKQAALARERRDRRAMSPILKSPGRYGDDGRDDYNQASKSTGNYGDEDDYNQESRPTGNYGDGDDYNQESRPTGNHGDGDDYNQASKSRGGYRDDSDDDDDDDDDYNRPSKRPPKGW